MKNFISENEVSRLRAPIDQAWTLPPSAYTQAPVFEREAEALFYREWICVAREEQVPESGDFLSVNVVKQPLIVVRQQDHSIRAMSAICPHRGMPVVDQAVTDNIFHAHITCGKFALDGSLISAPLMDSVENLPSDCRLAAIKVEVWQGFIFVNLDPKADTLMERLAKLNELVGAYDMSNMRIAGSVDYDCPWNWKLLVENFMEAYHHIGPHNNSLQGSYPARLSYTSGSVPDGWSVLHMPAVEEESLLPLLPGLDDRQQNQTLASVVMPTFCWINTPAVAFWYELKTSEL